MQNVSDTYCAIDKESEGMRTRVILSYLKVTSLPCNFALSFHRIIYFMQNIYSYAQITSAGLE